MKNILVLTYWSYNDALIQTYTLPYVRMIKKNLPIDSKIFLLTLEQKDKRISKENVKEIKSNLLKEGIILIPFNYYPFGIKAIIAWKFIFLHLIFLCIFKSVKKIHAFCTPAGGIGYLLSTITRIPLIIDSYEPHAESMVENGTWDKNSLAFQILFKLEKLQSQRAEAFIATSTGMLSYAREKYEVKLQNFYTKPACVDLDKFQISNEKYIHLIKELKLEDKKVCVYAGKLGGIYLKEEVFDLFSSAVKLWGNNFRVLLLTEANSEEVKTLAEDRNIPRETIIYKFVPHDEIPKYLSLADFAINPVKPVPTKRFCTSIKDGEYWAMGLPVIITPNISDDSDIIFNEKIGVVLEGFNPNAYDKALIEMDNLLNTDILLLKLKIRKVAEKYRNFEIAEEIYKTLYNDSK